jgi:hypothetical protein
MGGLLLTYHPQVGEGVRKGEPDECIPVNEVLPCDSPNRRTNLIGKANTFVARA